MYSLLTNALNWIYTITALILNEIIYHESHNFLLKRAMMATNSKNKDFNKEFNNLSYSVVVVVVVMMMMR